jgi:enoyl-CoA hydratase
MNFKNVLAENRDGVMWLTVNRPEKLNALNTSTMDEIEAVAASVAADDDVWALVVTGAGEKAFVAGADIFELNTLGPVEAKEFALRGQAVYLQIERMTKPVIAAVNGFALGGGCELAMACHMRIASKNAVFGQPEVKLGLIPGYGGTQRLPRLVGRGRALEILLTGRNVDAEEAERIGLVNAVCEQTELVDTVDAMLKNILANGPLAVGHCIEAVNHGLDLPFEDACLLEATLFGVGAASEQMREGTSAFLEKRKARFRS